MNRNLVLGLIVLIVAAAAVIFYATNQSDSAPATGATQSQTGNLSEGDLPTSADGYKAIVAYGDPAAPIKIIEFASMTCPHCAHFHKEDLPALKADYIDAGKVYLELHPFPLDMLAAKATMLSACGGDKNAAFTEVLFAQQGQWAASQEPIEALAKIAQLGGMSRADFDQCMADEALFNSIVKSRYDAQANYQIKGTPSFVINGTLISEPFNKSTFAKVLAD